ncbi:hypothetical protein [Corynebacterium pseudodiphtheriticum]|uniref:hypothetical protein n=1 Tax=Corynebacterium pseudodiphtheriticum TaxID=37637 RepID=UPI00047D8095|nr:hypothetical protein [Corynebacterium pseudodiphtheriticum]
MTLSVAFIALVWKVLWLIPVVALLQIARKILISNNPFISYMEERASAKLINALFWLAVLTVLGVVFT